MAVHDPVNEQQAAVRRMLRGACLEIRLVGGEDEILVEVEGELDLASARRLERRLQYAIAVADRVVLDVAALTFVDVAGLRPVLQAADDLRRRGGTLVVVGARGGVRRLVTVLEVGDRLGLVENRAEHEV